MGRRKDQEVIGIIGAGRSVGVTHFTVLTAGYISGVLRKSCAVLEWNDHEDFKHMAEVCQRRQKGDAWRILEADYYEKAGIETLLLCKKSGYEAILVDYGAASEDTVKEFLRCDRRFVLGSLSEWQIEEFIKLEERIRKTGSDFRMMSVFGSGEARKAMEKRFKTQILQIPFSPDAFKIEGKLLLFYQKL